MPEIRTAFVLGAGLGTRLQPLTGERPKPLVPLFNKPLLTFAFDHLLDAGVTRFVVNTHHLPEAFDAVLAIRHGRGFYRGREVRLVHEPVLLDTGGGILNARDQIGERDFFVYNADILSDLPLRPLAAAHAASKPLATLALRSEGSERRVQWNASSGLVTDLRGILGGRKDTFYLYAGVAVFSPSIFEALPHGLPVSFIPVLAREIAAGARVRGVLLDEGVWTDIGHPDAYLDAHRRLWRGDWKLAHQPPDWHRRECGCEPVDGFGAVAPGVHLPRRLAICNSVVWSARNLPPDARLSDCIAGDRFFLQCGTGSRD
jgi:NDP-sugar pyrophosphorylase family protein